LTKRTVHLWRIATETRTYPANDRSGNGAAKNPGRWNNRNEKVIYAAPSIALAVLETAAHIDDSGLPLNKFLVRLDVPTALIANAVTANSASLPVAWSAVPAGMASVTFGSKWYASQASAILFVPSVIVPEENIAIINARHPDMAKIKVVAVRLFEYNKLFRSR
jgi:RES domain-containing protein